jgi:hypothetical protein
MHHDDFVVLGEAVKKISAIVGQNCLQDNETAPPRVLPFTCQMPILHRPNSN